MRKFVDECSNPKLRSIIILVVVYYFRSLDMYPKIHIYKENYMDMK